MTAILIIDDDPLVRTLLVEYLRPFNHTLMAAESLAEGLDLLTAGKFDLVLLDVNLPDGNGLDKLPEIRRSVSEPEVIIITAEGNAAGAEMAIEHDVWDYILKPFSEHEIRLNVKRALEYRASKRARQPSAQSVFDRSHIIGSSPKLSARLNLAAQCAQSDANVLITGPTGTGKELFANTIHKNGLHREKGFIVVDCAALPEQLVESVLFGHVKGAYTGADSKREGLVKKADGGTLFLDEIGELPLSIQKKFLRVLQERRFKPVGGTAEIKSDFRLISATNRNLGEMVGEGTFRSDLLFRINTIHIDLPPLKECREDIKALALHYIHTLCEHHGLETKGFGPEFLGVLETYDWPGNTRELIACLEKAILANTASDMLYPNFLPPNIRLHSIRSSIREQGWGSLPGGPGAASGEPVSLVLPERLFNPVRPLKQVKNYTAAETEKIYLLKLMAVCRGDMDNASKLACVSKSRLYSLLKTHHIPRHR